ncbi:hypothetical protein Fot_12546 [Forsythia ovata]|uniref:Uncharacterized protein n=1 Tax=Forsythia ovata TaxID=205694 RepID=A0ABD1WN64_9LAMI
MLGIQLPYPNQKIIDEIKSKSPARRITNTNDKSQQQCLDFRMLLRLHKKMSSPSYESDSSSSSSSNDSLSLTKQLLDEPLGECRSHQFYMGEWILEAVVGWLVESPKCSYQVN